MSEKHGNGAKMREALERLERLSLTVWNSEVGDDVSAEIAEMVDICKAALAEPARICDKLSANELKL